MATADKTRIDAPIDGVDFIIVPPTKEEIISLKEINDEIIANDKRKTEALNAYGEAVKKLNLLGFTQAEIDALLGIK